MLINYMNVEDFLVSPVAHLACGSNKYLILIKMATRTIKDQNIDIPAPDTSVHNNFSPT